MTPSIKSYTVSTEHGNLAVKRLAGAPIVLFTISGRARFLKVSDRRVFSARHFRVDVNL